ncbi:disulfide bond formation protein B [Streptomyces sp. URMC 123]|uniref:disulfide bond formation protein B n=1 Tax=Streptomyces sp. URMC 123 TaxID=3423403 RepID=UPI003F1B0F3E
MSTHEYEGPLPTGPAGLIIARIGNLLGLWFAHLHVLGLSAVLLGQLVVQFGQWGHPTPLGTLQRVFLLLAALGPAYTIAISRERNVTTHEHVMGWGLSLLACLGGGAATLPELLARTRPGAPAPTGTVLGLAPDTWALVTFAGAAAGAVVMLVLTADLEPLDSSCPLLSVTALALLGAAIALNTAAVFLVQGLHTHLPREPGTYRLLYDLGLL